MASSLGRRAASIGISTIMSLVLVLFVILGVTFFFTNVLQAGQRTFDECPGECRIACGGDRPVTQSTRCYKNGELQRGMMCCVHPRDLEVDDPAPTPSPGVNALDKPSIEVRKGEVTDALIEHASTESLSIGSEYQYHIWGFGNNMSTCTVRILEQGNFNRFEHESLPSPIVNQPCVDNSKARNVFERNNRLLFNINPSPELAGKMLVLQVQLFDVNGVQNQSARINLEIGSLEEYFGQNCNDIVTQCPYFDANTCGIAENACINHRNRCFWSDSRSECVSCGFGCNYNTRHACEEADAFCPMSDCVWDETQEVCRIDQPGPFN